MLTMFEALPEGVREEILELLFRVVAYHPRDAASPPLVGPSGVPLQQVSLNRLVERFHAQGLVSH